MRRLLVLLILWVAVLPVGAQEPPTPTGALLVWLSTGPEPERKDPAAGSQLAAVFPNGVLTTLLEFDRSVIGVTRCGGQPISQDGRRFAFFANQPNVGVDSGTLYQMTDFGAPVAVATIHRIACALNGFAYSPDSTQVAYINYENVSDDSRFISGTLTVRDVEELQELVKIERAAAFVWDEGSLAALQFFANGAGEADEAVVTVWDGTASRELASVVAAQNCSFTGGQITGAGAEKIAMVLGERCRTGDGRTRWQIHLVDRATGSATLALSAPQDGGAFINVQTYNITTNSDDTSILFSAADGVSRESAAVYSVDLSTLSEATPVIDRAGIFRRYVPLRYTLGEIAPAVLSRDRQFWAVVKALPDKSELIVIDLANLSAPITIPLQRSSDSVRAMGFTPDSTALVYVAGDKNGADNAVFRLDLVAGVEQRLTRGQFASVMAVRADGAAALLQYRRTDEAQSRP
ncbi:MAG: hypothetical protein MUC99_11175, partial [Anaerolineae bacterium]|nr:hypothetical protein [Anaerolineae bacterium]